MSPIHDFFKDLDLGWNLSAKEKIRLHLIGSTALMLQVDYTRGTKDSDVLETADMDLATRARLEAHAGLNTKLSQKHRLYLEVVGNGLPLLPQRPQWRAVPDLNRGLAHFHINVLSVVDVVVSKLKRFNGSDVRDIEAMVDRGLVPHAELVERFRSAVDSYVHDSRADHLPKYIANLHRVERDLLGKDESEIDLPDWVGD